MIRTYSELIKLPTFAERLAYLQVYGEVGADTFGTNRIFNQRFYTSREWRNFRHNIVVRDNGCDLGVKECEIPDGVRIYIHHLNPITLEDIQLGRYDKILNSENVITTIFDTHQIIHYGKSSRNSIIQERTSNDTCPWKKIGG